jgi:hypothetical protein
MGKTQRNPPIQCWGCGGDYMYRDFPHICEKLRFVQKVQHAKIVEDMGRNIPSIYTTLDNKQARFQLHIIEVEGEINNEPISILIDSGSSHSYLDHEMVEIFQLLRKNLGKPWLVKLAT